MLQRNTFDKIGIKIIKQFFKRQPFGRRKINWSPTLGFCFVSVFKVYGQTTALYTKYHFSIQSAGFIYQHTPIVSNRAINKYLISTSISLPLPWRKESWGGGCHWLSSVWIFSHLMFWEKISSWITDEAGYPVSTHKYPVSSIPELCLSAQSVASSFLCGFWASELKSLCL